VNAETRDQLDAAICRQTDPELWFPEVGGDHSQAKRLCRKCPLVGPCLQYALDNRIEFGIWGSASPRERKRLLKDRRAA
jgi:WhiB family transcriptional regulator, redox-sensing transcriptional regulator